MMKLEESGIGKNWKDFLHGKREECEEEYTPSIKKEKDKGKRKES